MVVFRFVTSKSLTDQFLLTKVSLEDIYDGTEAVMHKQASYDGALGARGIHNLQTYGQETAYDGCAYTFTSTYSDGTLKMFTSHPTKPRREGERPGYYMNQVKGWCITSDIEAFRQGATWFRNGRDLAERWRNDFIKAANNRLHSNGDENDSPSTESLGREDTSASVPDGDPPESDTSQDDFYDTKQSA